MIRIMNDENIFGERLKKTRLDRGLTQGQVQARTKLHWTAIAHFEKGRRTPSLANLRRLCEALDVSADYLIGLSDDPIPRPKPAA